MLERVKAHPALTPGGVVAEQIRDEAVRRLMKGDGDQDRQQPDRDLECDKVERLIHHYGFISRPAVLPAAALTAVRNRCEPAALA